MRRNFDRGFKNNYRDRDVRDRRNDENDRYRNNSNKNFGRNNEYKKPRRDYDNHSSYQDRRDGGRYDGGYDRASHRSNDHSKNERSFRNHSPPQRSRDRDDSKGGYRNDTRRRMSPPPSSRGRNNDYKPPSNIKSRLAPVRSRIVTNSSRILRRNDIRGGMITKRVAPLNRAKDYARKIRQARMKLNEGRSTSSSSKLKSTIESKSPRKDSDEMTTRKNEDNNDEDYLAIANDVNFDEDENESTGGKNSTSKIDIKIKEEKEENSTVGEDDKKIDGNKASLDDEQPSTSKDDKESRTSRHEHKSSKSRSRTPSKERVRKFDRIEYVCIHCSKRSTSAQEYRSHLSSRRHLLAMRNVGLRVRATLNRLRKVQRDKQLEIEALIKGVEDIPSKYCSVCKLNFRQSKDEHHESEDHKKIHSFLKPYCKICRLQLISPMKYEIHRCHTDHIRRKLKAQEGSDDEIDMQSMDIGDFKTIDSTGEVDDVDAIDEDLEDDVNQSPGIECISKVESHYCSLCHDFICRHGDENEDKLIAEHCKLRRHLNRHHDYKREEEKKNLKAKSPKESKDVKEEAKKKKSPEKTAASKQNGGEAKVEKLSSNEVDRDADVNLDDNTYEGSENPEDDS